MNQLSISSTAIATPQFKEGDLVGCYPTDMHLRCNWMYEGIIKSVTYSGKRFLSAIVEVESIRYGKAIAIPVCNISWLIPRR